MSPPVTDKDGRMDVLSLKQQLAEALGDNGPSYWQALTDFVSGKLNRQEFDFYANLYLSRQNAPLHNQFILATIHNAQKAAPPPSTRSVGWSKGKKDKDGKKEKDPRRRKIKNEVMSLGKAERERIKALKDQNDQGQVKQRLKEHRIVKPLAPSVLPQPLLAEYNRGAHAPLCFDSKELPNFEAMRDRMTAIAYENGLMGGVQEDSVELVLHALESHVKSIISNCIIKLRTNRAIGISVPRREPAGKHPTLTTLAVPPSSSTTAFGTSAVSSPFMPSIPHGSTSSSLAMDTSDSTTPNPSAINNLSSKRSNTNTITAKDLAFAIDISPSMMVESPANVEKLLSILMESESEEDEDMEMDEEDEFSDSMIEL
ncbi:hypothetical protein BGZ83_008407 [Gryganskiella cystojenkinii]|nr:hypothetical protein BGZ83_008407 [Gryganskiella cystojenkinii]